MIFRQSNPYPNCNLIEPKKRAKKWLLLAIGLIIKCVNFVCNFIKTNQFGEVTYMGKPLGPARKCGLISTKN